MKTQEPEKHYLCRECSADINEGEYKTFGVCDDCWDKAYPKKEEK